MNMKMQNDNFTTSDLGLASALTACGFEMIGVNRADPKRALFVFRKKDVSQQKVDDYFSGKLQVSALAYFNAQKNIKALLHQGG